MKPMAKLVVKKTTAVVKIVVKKTAAVVKTMVKTAVDFVVKKTPRSKVLRFFE